MTRVQARSPFPGTLMVGANVALDVATTSGRTVRRSSADVLVGVRRANASIALISGLEATRGGGQRPGQAVRFGVAAGFHANWNDESLSASIEVTHTQHTGGGGPAHEEVRVGFTARFIGDWVGVVLGRRR